MLLPTTTSKWHDAASPMMHVIGMRGRKPTTPLGKWPNSVAPLRVSQGMTQEELAAASGVELKTIQKIERWAQRVMPAQQAKLAPVLKTTFEQLIAAPGSAAQRNAEPTGGTAIDELRKMQSTFTRAAIKRWPNDDPDGLDEISAKVGELLDLAYKLGRKAAP